MYVFIAGSPRSGTTLLANLLGRHPAIGVRYEPYYVWERYFALRPDDVLTREDADDKVIRYISKSFHNYREKTGNKIIIDKSPRSSLRISFIKRIFPGSKWVHIIRDGRDATLSIYKRWQLMDNITGDNKYSKGAFEYLADRLSYEKFFTDKLRFLWHETHTLLKYRQLLSKLRWDGETGWGPRFNEYRQILKTHSRLEFCAHQWLACINSVEQDIAAGNINDTLTVHYEDLIKDGPATLTNILNFLGCQYTKELYSDTVLRLDNTQKWIKGFSSEQLQKLHPIITPRLVELGYERDDDWMNTQSS